MIYFIGIKGAGMASLACMLNDIGEKVAGSDIDKHIFTEDELRKRQIPIYKFNEVKIEDHATVVVGNAFGDDFSEVVSARKNSSLHIIRYHDFLGTLMNQYKSIAIAGSHGKTTTTTMVASMLSPFFDTGYLIGDGQGHLGKHSTHLAVEACEYRRHFLAYHPDIAIITNVDIDHVDYFKSEEDYASAYEQFSTNIKGTAIIYGDDPRSRLLSVSSKALYYGLHEDNDIVAKNVIESSTHTEFDCLISGKLFGHFILPFVGSHMLQNSLAVIGVGYLEGLSAMQIELGLGQFKGAKRRFVVEEVMGSVFIDDYAHHPTEVKVTIEAAKKRYPHLPLIAIFKPHRVSRVFNFAKPFADALKVADVVALCPFTSIDDAEEGYDIDISYLQGFIEGSIIVDDNEEDAKVLASFKPAVYLFMSSKDIYSLSDRVKRYHQS